MGAGKPRRRLARALVIVLVPLALLALCQPVAELPGGGEKLSSEAGLCAANGAPDWFIEEVTEVAGRGELRANDDWSVVSYVAEEEAALAAAALVDDLEERGWTLVESGREGIGTGVKEGGRCSWLAFSCTSVGDATCVVIQVVALQR